MHRFIDWLADRYLSLTWPAATQPEQHLAVEEEQREVWEPGELPGLVPKRNPEFDDLPTVQVLSARITDDDIEFISDLKYLADLKIDIFAHASVFRRRAASSDADLAVAPQLLRGHRMRTSIVRAFALGIITGSFLTAGTLAFALPVKADVDRVVVAYASSFGEAVCTTLDAHPSFDGLLGVGRAIIDDGLTTYQAGQVIALSVLEVCPRHTALLMDAAGIGEQVA